MNNENRENIQLVFNRLYNFDEIYLVGGSVRDYILGVPIKDFDFAVPYTPVQIKAKLKESGFEKTFDIGEKFGTIGCLIQGLDIEITTFRGEQYNYLDRKPEVSYIQTIEEDIKRRDFTINALYVDREEAKLLWKFNPKDKHRVECLRDVTDQQIRAVGDPARRFKEDPLRMLRAIRFAAKYGFTITEKTFDMIIRLRVELLKVSVERWVMELDKILSLKKPNLQLLADSHLLDIMIPELSYQIDFDQNSSYHNYQLWEHTIKVVEATPCDNLNLRWAALLHDIGKPFTKIINKKGHFNYMGHEIMSAYLVNQIGYRLKWTKERTKSVSELAQHHLNDYCELRKYDNAAKKE